MESRSRTNLDMENDCEVDCCPVDASDKLKPIASFHNIKHRSIHGVADADDEGYDSKFNSERSTDSFSSGCFMSAEGRLKSSEHEPSVPVKPFSQLSLHTKLSADGEHTRLESVDEGFVSQDLRPLDLSLKSTGSVNSSNSKPDNAEAKDDVDDVTLRAYIQRVNETYQQDEEGDTRVHTAIIQLLVDIVLYFISLAPCPSYLNIKNNRQQTPLHLAAITRQPELARKLVTAGAQIDPRDHRGNTPLHIAAKAGYHDVMQVLMEPVHFEETRDNSYEIPYQAIPQDLEARNYDGQVCVHLAAEGGHLNVLDVLLNKDNPANINCRDGKSGRTMLHYAAESSYLPLLQYLLSKPGIDVNALTYSRQTPIMLARGRGNVEAVRLLKEGGAFYESESDEEYMNEDPYDDDFKIGGNLV